MRSKKVARSRSLKRSRSRKRTYRRKTHRRKARSRKTRLRKTWSKRYSRRRRSLRKIGGAKEVLASIPEVEKTIYEKTWSEMNQKERECVTKLGWTEGSWINSTSPNHAPFIKNLSVLESREVLKCAQEIGFKISEPSDIRPYKRIINWQTEPSRGGGFSV